jgi:hypothetical protein
VEVAGGSITLRPKGASARASAAESTGARGYATG